MLIRFTKVAMKEMSEKSVTYESATERGTSDFLDTAITPKISAAIDKEAPKTPKNISIIDINSPTPVIM